MIKKRRVCLVFLVILLSGCATSTINTDPYALRAMVDVDENSINDQEIYQDDMQFCSFEAAYNDVSNKGGLAAGSIGAAAGAAAATPAYLLAAPIAILAGGVAYFLGKGAEKGVEGNRRVQMMVNCLENKGYMVSLTGDYSVMEEEKKKENQCDESIITGSHLKRCTNHQTSSAGSAQVIF